MSYHYLNRAKRNFIAYLTGAEVKLKKYLYVLRPLLACDRVAETNTMVPMEFHMLLERLMPTGPLRTAVDARLVEKMRTGEMGKAPQDPILHGWIKERLAPYESHPPEQ